MSSMRSFANAPVATSLSYSTRRSGRRLLLALSMLECSVRRLYHARAVIGSARARVARKLSLAQVLAANLLSCAHRGWACVGAKHQLQAWQESNALPRIELSLPSPQRTDRID